MLCVQPGKKTSKGLTYGMTQSARSAASFYYQWDLQASFPGQAVRGQNNRNYLLEKVSPTDELNFTLQSGGMSQRMGTKVEPSWALQHVHIQFMMDYFDQAWDMARDDDTRQEIASAALATLLLWLGWTRGGETFSIT